MASDHTTIKEDEGLTGLLERAREYGREQRYFEVLELCESLEREDPSNLEVLYLQGGAHYKLGDFASAIRSWEQILEFQPDNHQAREWLERATSAIAGQDFDQPLPEYEPPTLSESALSSLTQTVTVARPSAGKQPVAASRSESGPRPTSLHTNIRRNTETGEIEVVFHPRVAESDIERALAVPSGFEYGGDTIATIPEARTVARRKTLAATAMILALGAPILWVGQTDRTVPGGLLPYLPGLLLEIMGMAVCLAAPIFFLWANRRPALWISQKTPEATARHFYRNLIRAKGITPRFPDPGSAVLLLAPTAGAHHTADPVGTLHELWSEWSKEWGELMARVARGHVLDTATCKRCRKKGSGLWSRIERRATAKDLNSGAYVLCGGCGAAYCPDCLATLPEEGRRIHRCKCGKTLDNTLVLLRDPHLHLSFRLDTVKERQSRFKVRIVQTEILITVEYSERRRGERHLAGYIRCTLPNVEVKIGDMWYLVGDKPNDLHRIEEIGSDSIPAAKVETPGPSAA
ncbi:MAG: hypothetical protein HUU16_03210 [Candidatus Omnitrophica bacterium]|nr:hypothetical protein [Candidatus Omnitrophota bacterium]